MASTGAQRTHVRLAAALLASLLAAFVVLTYLSYTAAFSSFDTVTVTAPRAGLVMDRGGKVKYRGIQIGTVDNISYSDDQAQLTLAIDAGELSYVPANAAVHIASNTIFGAKSVEFIAPKTPLANALRPGAHVAASAVSLEVNTLFQSLIELLHKIDPVELNGTLGAFAEGLRGHGNDFGRAAGRTEYPCTADKSKTANSPAGFPEDGCGGQHLLRRGARPGHRVQQHADDRQDGRGPAEQPEQSPAGGNRVVQQRL